MVRIAATARTSGPGMGSPRRRGSSAKTVRITAANSSALSAQRTPHLFRFRILCRGRFRAVVFVDRHGLVGVEGAAAASVEHLWHGLYDVSALIPGDRENVALFYAISQVVADHVRRGRIGRPARRRPQLRQRCRVSIELGIILRLGGMDGPY